MPPRGYGAVEPPPTEEGQDIARRRQKGGEKTLDLLGALRGGALETLKAIAYNGFKISLDSAWGVIGIMQDPRIRDEIQAVRAEMAFQILQVPYKTFKKTWFTARNMVSLQGRLYIEHILWNLGPPWSDLITGFKPGTEELELRPGPAPTPETGPKGRAVWRSEQK